ncbi:hypothetical protein fugu_008539 [Takifugu bimaculatus]|uniref:SMP-LTD domain-containing protein n=1 Tax=Takifugu bimaculatus TaxID=433685 RepID=A0A4Z2B3Y9_9TELE|nr:hypothetical protein fugu_008539 [Takifugu bimaculatus]
MSLRTSSKPQEDAQLESPVGECGSRVGLNGTEDPRTRPSGSSAMTSKRLRHEECVQPTKRPAPAGSPKLHVQRSPSRDTVTIRFSALGREEEEEEEEGLFVTTVSPTSAAQDESLIVTGVEACEEMFEEETFPSEPEDALLPEAPPAQLLPSHIVEQKGSSCPPIKSLSFPSSDSPFPTVVKSLSSEAEPRDGLPPTAAPTLRHRQLMKTLVKSLSSDTSQDSSSTSYRLPEPRLNLQLFKQFTQSRAAAAAAAAGDSKTAPCSPLTSPDRGGFFKVSEVEAKFEDTKRRLSEVISEPLQLLSKIMDEKSGSLVGGGIYRPKPLSVSASELSGGTNGHVESNNNYCIKEEDGAEWEEESRSSQVSTESPVSLSADAKSPNKSSSRSVSLEKCSMSALAKQEDEEFCILYSDDFDNSVETEASGSQTDDGAPGRQADVPPSARSQTGSDADAEAEGVEPNVPLYTLTVVTLLVYGYFVLPLPSYVGGLLLGIGLGFLLAIGVVWLTGLKSSNAGFGHSRDPWKLWNLTKLDIKEPEMYKGWMNEISSYDPEMYHATMTHSVFVRLEGSVIRLSKPNHNVARRATHNEPKHDVTYISQKIYDLSNSRVYLLPQNLARKRLWNKKYPICIDLGKQDDFMSKAEGERPEGGEGSRGEERSSGSPSRELTLYLFGRTGREKEEWFQHFLAASRFKADLKKALCVSGAKSEAQRSHSRSSSRSSLEETLTSQPRSRDASSSSPPATGARAKPLLDYGVYMATVLPKRAAVASAAASPLSQSPQSSPGADKKFQSSTPAEVQPSGDEEQEDHAVAWVNAAVGRIFWDFLTEPHWAELVSKKIQMKLSKIRLPYFMNELTLTELDMGSATPRILKASEPSIDYRGKRQTLPTRRRLWFSLDVSYSGSFLMTLETKMNLIRLGKEDETSRSGECGKDGPRPRTYCLADSDEESSSAGSSDEEDFSEISNESAGPDGWAGGHKPSKIMRFVDKITKSKYFQKATETEFIKKKMEEVSNTPLLLTVEVQQLQGTLAVNIPPPPTDRIWYGFRTPPHLELKARPKLGEREVTLAHVTDWIERKLEQEFQKIFVMPNMDDVWLSVMHSAMDQRSSGGPLASSGLEPRPSEPKADGGAQP